MRSLWLVFLLLLLTTPLLAAGLPGVEADSPVDIEADQLTFDQVTGRYHAQGNVRLTQGTLTLSCDQLWWNRQTGEVEASGDTRLWDAGEKLSGRKITYNLGQGTGTVEDGEVFWQEKSLRLSGERIERRGPKTFRLYDGRITVCDSERPAWSVGTSQADVTIGRYLTARHALIYIKDIPAFYLPYLVVPVKTERESGFLLPRLGFSDTRGTEFSTAWYQVLGRNMDATFYLDHLSKLGTGTGLEYRYIFGRRQKGNFRAYNVFVQQGSQQRSLAWQHMGQFSDHLRAVVDAEYVNSRDYYKDYSELAGEYNKQKTITSVFVNQRWEKASLTAQYKAIKDLESSSSHPWQSAPLVDFSLAPRRIKSLPLYAGLQSSYIRFSPESGASGERLMVRPTLSLHRYLFSGIEFNSEYGYRLRHYLQADNAAEKTSGREDFSARLASRIFRVYGDSHRSWLHSIEPEISYTYVEDDQDAGLPDFDRFDHSTPENKLGYSLVSRFTGKWIDAEGGETRRELVWMKLSQTYNLQRQNHETNPFSDLRTEVIMHPTSKSALTLDTYLDPDSGRFFDTRVGGRLHDGHGNSFEGDYHTRDAVGGSAPVKNINAKLSTALLKPLYLGYEQRYDLQESKRLEQVIDLDFRLQCWGLKIALREREEERSIMFILSLGGIGEIGGLGTSYGGG